MEVAIKCAKGYWTCVNMSANILFAATYKLNTFALECGKYAKNTMVNAVFCQIIDNFAK